MKKIKLFAFLILLAGWVTSPACAFLDELGKWSPVQFNVAGQTFPGAVVITGLNLNFKFGMGGERQAEYVVYGVDSGLFPDAERVYGLQAGLATRAHTVILGQAGAVNEAKNIYGVQAGVFSNTTRWLYGAQLGLVNTAGDLDSDRFSGFGGQLGLYNRGGEENGAEFYAAQAGLVNEAYCGVGQLGLINSAGMAGAELGLLNVVGGSVYGGQAGLFNSSSYLEGAAAALFNYSEEVDGVQAGAFNMAESMRGVQIGLINVAGRLRGVQIGVLNFISKASAWKVLPIVNIRFMAEGK